MPEEGRGPVESRYLSAGEVVLSDMPDSRRRATIGGDIMPAMAADFSQGTRNMSTIHFETELFEINSWTILRLPESASAKLPLELPRLSGQ
jgi:hypothetical protein